VTEANGPSWRHAISLLTRLLNGDTVRFEELDLARAALMDLVSSELPPVIGDDDVNSPYLNMALDIMRAVSLMEDDDSAHPWNRAALAASAKRYTAAAHYYLESSRRSYEDMPGGTQIDSEEVDWANTAVYHASRYFAMGGQLFSACVLMRKVRDQRPIQPGKLSCVPTS